VRREINQRELRNDSGEIMRKADEPEHRHAQSCSGWRPRLTGAASAPTWTRPRAKTGHPLPEQGRHRRGLLDTSVVIDIETLDPSQLPVEVAVSAVTMAELAAGPPCDDRS
jgi:hypothetical protein